MSYSVKGRVTTKPARARGKRARKEIMEQTLLDARQRTSGSGEIVRKPVKPRNKEISPLTEKQALYDQALRENSIIFATGPAGTGKTWWAAQRAAEAYLRNDIQSIIITRPAVETGESLGFLPGELEDKYEPYFRPVRDAFVEALGEGHLDYALKVGTIEARPLAYMRGATFKNCWVILDEAQNVSPQQMKMFLSRIGENCKMVIDGDLDQKDIQGVSGLEDAVRRLKGLADVEMIEFDYEDVVRSGLCLEVLKCYRK